MLFFGKNLRLGRDAENRGDAGKKRLKNLTKPAISEIIKDSCGRRTSVTEAEMIEIRKVGAEELYPLRLRVLRNGSVNPADAMFAGDEDEDSVHIALIDGGIVGCASLIRSSNEFLEAENPYRLRGVAVAPESRGKGYARAIAAYAEYCAFEEKNADILWFYARERAAAFYEKLGYKHTGDALDIEGIGTHFLMYKTVADFHPGCGGCH